MAKYKFVDKEQTMVYNNETDFSIPVGSGNWMDNDYQAWLAAGNVTDPWVDNGGPPPPYEQAPNGEQTS